MRLTLLALATTFAAVTAVAAEEARLDVYVFDAAGAPLADASVVADDVTGTTDDTGWVALQVSVGDVTLVVQGHEVGAVPTVAGKSSEVLVTVGDGWAKALGIEAPTPRTEEEVEVEEDAGPPGRITGRVLSAEDGSPLAQASVYVRGLEVTGETDADGRFVLETPPGSWDLSTVRVGFSTASITVEVASGEQTATTVEMFPAAARLDDFVVRAPRIKGGASSLLLERKESASVADVLGAEQMSAAGDSDAAGALKRVPGLTVVGGRYVYVRGLGERYSSTLMNGAGLPSPEPERRVVPLDLFPTKVLESVVIQKTFSPDMPAEFGGGVIRLRTRSIPDEPVARISVSTGFRTGETFQKGLTYATGPTDFLGIDGGWRDLPETVQEASNDEPLEEGDMFSDRGYSAAELEKLGESMPNRWNLSRRVLRPDLGLNVTLGHGLREDDGRGIGFLLGVGYGIQERYDDFERRYYLIGGNDTLEQSHTYRFEAGRKAVRLGGIMTLGWSPHGTQNFSSTTLVARKTDDEARTYEGMNRDVGADIRVTRLRFIERMLVTQQFRGSHVIEPLSNLTIDWRYTFSVAGRNEPDRREYRVDNEPGTDRWLLSDRPEGNSRFFSELGDEGHDVGFDVTLPFKQWSGLDTRVRIGGNWFTKSRTVDTRRFKFIHKGPLSGDGEILSRSPEEAYVPETIGSDGFQFEEVTRQTDNYTAGQDIGSVYGLIDIGLTPWLRILAGARLENSKQRVSTFELFNPDGEPVDAELNTLDVLPAFTATFKLMEDMQVRAGYGMTVSRPDFRELSPATFNDVTGGRQTFGNPELERARIHNVDARWEWYPTSSESISAGVFYKHFVKPIEQIVVVSAQHSVSWDNAESADNIGFEVDWKKDFAFIHPKLADLYFSGNVAVVYSRVQLGENSGIQSSDERALQGQSPVVVNLQVGYDNPVSGTRLAMLYNVFGRRIGEVGALGAPDNYEESFHQLDFVASQKLPAGFRVGLKVQNILNPWERFTQGDEEIERDKRGVKFGLSLEWDMARAAKSVRERREAKAP